MLILSLVVFGESWIQKRQQTNMIHLKSAVNKDMHKNAEKMHIEKKTLEKPFQSKQGLS